jgi:osmotically-inducible protein OsmY
MKRTTAFGLAMLAFASTGSITLAKAPDADNTAQNKGSLNKNAVTADKQGNSKNEVEVTASVRKAIMAEKGLSINAQNVKIIYRNGGLVTLRGPVDSAEEKAKLVELAKACAGVNNVKDLITIKKHS